MKFGKLFSIGSIVGLASALPWGIRKHNSIPKVTLNTDDTIYGTFYKGVEAFRGIPFAEPPVGNLRFRPPVPYSLSLNGFKAKNYGPTCISFSPFGTFDFFGKIANKIPEMFASPSMDFLKVGVMSEDCLSINIWRPEGTKEGDNLPVMVWIHGGAYQFGSPPAFPGDPYIKTSMEMKQPVIFVSVPYRMGPYGFLGGSAIHKEGSSNVGFLDQRLGLQWVADNIYSFGGNPDKVTLIGESAGAMSIGFHLVAYGGDNTYNGKPLFHSAIFQSGAALSVLDVTSNKPQNLFRKLGTGVNCKGNDDEMLQCLREIPVETIRAYIDKISSNMANSFNLLELFMGFSPRVDGTTILENPVDSLKNGNFTQIPYITGNQEDEGTIFTSTLSAVSESRNATDSTIKQILAENDQEHISQFLALYPNDPAQGAPFRTGTRWAKKEQTKRISALLTDLLFMIPRRLHLQYTPEDIPKYVYFSDALHGTPQVGTYHSADLTWQFHANGVPSKAYRNYFIAFANSHDPNKNSGLPHWPLYDTEERKTLRIGLTILDEMKDYFPQVGREEAVMFAVENDFLAL